MKKAFLLLATLAFISLSAIPEFEHTVLVTIKGPDQYLAQFTIDKIVDGNKEPVTRPEVLCTEGKESVINKEVGNDGYTITALVFKENSTMKIRTSIIVQENNEVVYIADDEFDIE